MPINAVSSFEWLLDTTVSCHAHLSTSGLFPFDVLKWQEWHMLTEQMILPTRERFGQIFVADQTYLAILLLEKSCCFDLKTYPWSNLIEIILKPNDPITTPYNRAQGIACLVIQKGIMNRASSTCWSCGLSASEKQGPELLL